MWGTLLPFLRWYLWTYTLTNKRIVEQKGILTRTGRVIPLSRINDVAYEKNLNDRILRLRHADHPRRQRAGGPASSTTSRASRPSTAP